MIEQLSLAPGAPVKARNRKVPLRYINLEEVYSVDRDLLQSVQDLGVLEPVILQMVGDRYEVIDGRRRCGAAVAAGLRSVPARIVEVDGWLGQEVLSILLNEQRGPNPVSELQAIETLVAAGKSLTQIARATGMDVITIRKRLKLARLSAPLREALERGDLKAPLAESIAVLPEALQAQLADKLMEGGKLTAGDVREVREVRHDHAAAELGDIVAQTAMTTEALVTTWEGFVLRLLEQAVERIPENEPWAWTPIVEVVNQLKRALSEMTS